MTLHIFLFCLLASSVLTGLATEAVKALLTEWGKNYHANTLAGIIALIIGGGLGGSYVVLAGIVPDARTAIYLVALVFLSWLCAMVGYDKVVQAIAQFRAYGDTK